MGNYITMETPTTLIPITTDPTNGLCLCDHYIPEEVVNLILSYVPPNELLKLTLVCKNWNHIIKNPILWLEIYRRTYPKRKVKHLPWYVYYVLLATNFFDTNFIRNGNGEEKFKYWKITKNLGDGFQIENEPNGAPGLPSEVVDFNGNKSCFATSYYECSKYQVIDLSSRPVYSLILKKYKPHILASEWTCPRFDCASVYKLRVQVSEGSEEIMEYEKKKVFEQWSDPVWEKVEMKVIGYPDNIKKIIFEHEGKDMQFWKGYYGSKMAGAVVTISFDSIN